MSQLRVDEAFEEILRLCFERWCELGAIVQRSPQFMWHVRHWPAAFALKLDRKHVQELTAESEIRASGLI
jgi:hypothetical protein